MIRKALLLCLLVAILLAAYLLIKRSKPDKDLMQTQLITLDSIAVTGPVVFIHDRPTGKDFWLKSYTTIHAEEFDSLKGSTAKIHYMKVLVGPFENRIFKIEINSKVVFDQEDEE